MPFADGIEQRMHGKVIRINDCCWTSDGICFSLRDLRVMIVAAADSGNTKALVEILLPEAHALARAVFISAIHGLNDVNQTRINLLLRRPSASHALLSGGSIRMIDGKDRTHLLRTFEKRLRRSCVAYAEIKELCRPKKISVAPESGDFASRNEEELVKIGL